MITESCIDKIKQTISIQEVIGSLIKLKKNGSTWSGLCPFHGEKSPSFNVNTPRQFYKCFGCGESGDAIEFVMKHEKKTFVEAIEWMANFYHINIEYQQENAEEKAKRYELKCSQEGMKKVMVMVNNIYQNNLMSLDDSSNIWQYLRSRGIDRTIASDWQIGYAPMDRKNVTTRLINENMYQSAIETGIIKTDAEGVTKDFFCNRILFPIHDINGNVISMGGRIIPKEGEDNKKFPKWKNLPESELYKKSHVLYGLYQALTAKALNQDKNGENAVILVEGYTDVISMHTAGVYNTVASCGTSITKEQLKLIKRYTNTIELYQDGTTEETKDGMIKRNDSGAKSMIRIIESCIAENLNAYVVVTPGKDPDEYAREYEIKHNSQLKNSAAA